MHCMWRQLQHLHLHGLFGLCVRLCLGQWLVLHHVFQRPVQQRRHVRPMSHQLRYLHRVVIVHHLQQQFCPVEWCVHFGFFLSDGDVLHCHIKCRRGLLDMSYWLQRLHVQFGVFGLLDRLFLAQR
jgi:hypothetical protein